MSELTRKLSRIDKMMPRPLGAQLKIDLGASAITAAIAPFKHYERLTTPFLALRTFVPPTLPSAPSLLMTYPFKSIEQALGLPAAVWGVNAALIHGRPNFDVLRVVRSPLDIASGMASFIQTLERLNAGALGQLLNVRFPVMEQPAVTMAHLAREGWFLDPILLIAGDDMLRFLEAEPEDWNKNEVAAALQSIISAHEQGLLVLVTRHLEFLLADDPIAMQSHQAAFMTALDTLASGQSPALIAQSMIARTEGVFNRAHLSRGCSKKEAKDLLYSGREDRVKIRGRMLSDALERAITKREADPDPADADVPYWQTAAWSHKRLELAITAFTQKHDEEDDLPFDVEGARNHAQHDGVGTEALDWAVRSVLWFAGIAVVLGSIMEPLTGPGAGPTAGPVQPAAVSLDEPGSTVG